MHLVAHHSLLYLSSSSFFSDTRAVGNKSRSYQVDVTKKNGKNESLALSDSKQIVILANAALGHSKTREISAKKR